MSIYLGDSWDSYCNNTAVANGIDVPQDSPLEVDINANGRYLFVSKEGQGFFSLCEFQVWASDTLAPSPSCRVKCCADATGPSNNIYNSFPANNCSM